MSPSPGTLIPLRRPTESSPPPPAPAPVEAPPQEKLLLDEPGATDEAPSKKTPRGGFTGRRMLLGGVGLLALVGAVSAAGLYYDYSTHFATTDDAFIAARQFAVAPKVPGYLTSVPVTDNQHVGTGDVIARIDQRDYQVALAQAEAAIAAAQAGIANIAAQIEVQKAQIAASETQVKLSEARLVYAQQQAERYSTLTKEGWSSHQTGELALSELYQQQAAVSNAQANVTVAHRQLDALEAQRNSALANLREVQAKHDQAALNLSYTTVTAAQPGRIVQLGAAVGEFAQAGTALSMFVPDEIWVVANFKETQLDAMRPGQPVSFRIDAYPGREIHGHVASVQPGSGTAFSLLPAENATGNYVKIVQRVPVKVVIDHAPTDVALGPGMSVVPTVRTDPAPSLYERLRSWL
ncbi:MAG: HlyD family secretion protein [Reyranella sp.]|uniref:HlyD family secretion protein n=1 Tax=Reyranella sp. TaxID=1929291 RepID=UPI0011F4D647|nr:MAG: HlyD family secretion protein [Reyranella sp.]TBR27570.1 MAG: HlyD family secretion protein [Reyranella sp.]